MILAVKGNAVNGLFYAKKKKKKIHKRTDSDNQ